ncbi:MAG: FHA domain-containing protein [Nitrospinae bacterium]|nr:FHA domain-containing protein [Nitrospinota bacterium]MBF0634457.1 FHA domain-containing protein [Nitrospinota bacterium]
MTFEELFNNPDYRILVEKRRTLRSLKEKVSEWRNLYEELERRYANELAQAELALAKVESDFDLSPVAAAEMVEDMESTLAEVVGAISTLRRELKLNRLRRANGEYGEENYIGKRKELCSAIKNELSNEAWIKDLLALVKRNLKTPVQEKPIFSEPAIKPVKTQKIPLGQSPEMEFDHDELKFDNPSQEPSAKPEAKAAKEKPTSTSKPPRGKPASDQTSVISEEMIGSAPLRMLEAALQVQKGEGWERHPLERRDINIGNIRNPENDIGLYDTQTSRRHAKIVFDAVTESWFFVDLGSTNGSSINGRAATPNDPILLRNNDTLMVGDTKVMVYIP